MFMDNIWENPNYSLQKYTTYHYDENYLDKFRIYFYGNNCYLNKAYYDSGNIHWQVNTNSHMVDNIYSEMSQVKSVKDLHDLRGYYNHILSNLDLLEKHINQSLQQFQILKSQFEILQKIYQNVDEQSIINEISDLKTFSLIIDHIADIDIKYIKFCIPQFQKLIKHCSYSNLESYCYSLYIVCTRLEQEEQYDLLKKIYTNRFNKILFKKFQHILHTNEINQNMYINKNSNEITLAEKCQFLVMNTNLGNLIRGCIPLKKMYDEYYQSLLVLDKLV